MGFRKDRYTKREWYDGEHRFEHWYRDNTVYFITARTRDGVPVFISPGASELFWHRFEHYSHAYGFVPWVTTLMSNHYHTVGYLRHGEGLGAMMRKLHGSVAKLANDCLERGGKSRHVPFWRERGGRDYFDGCLRDEKQCRLAYRYTMMQSVRAGLVRDWRDYPDTRMKIDVNRGVKRALELNAFMTGIPYRRYEK